MCQRNRLTRSRQSRQDGRMAFFSRTSTAEQSSTTPDCCDLWWLFTWHREEDEKIKMLMDRTWSPGRGCPSAICTLCFCLWSPSASALFGLLELSASSDIYLFLLQERVVGEEFPVIYLALFVLPWLEGLKIFILNESKLTNFLLSSSSLEDSSSWRWRILLW